MTDTITLPRSVVERALEALTHAEQDCADFQRVNTDQTGEAIEALRATLEQPKIGEVVVTTNQQGQCVAVTRQDEEGQILSIIWEAKQPQVGQEPFAVLVRKHSWHLDTWEVGPHGNLDYGRAWADERINVYTHPQNLNCKSNQHRLATLWGYERPQLKREPLTDKVIQELADEGVFHANIFEIVRRIEEEHGIFKMRAHKIGGEA